MKNFQKTLVKILFVLAIFIAMLIPYAQNIVYAEGEETSNNMVQYITDQTESVGSKTEVAISEINNQANMTVGNSVFQNVGGAYDAEFSYTGDEQFYTIKREGTYILEAWGAGSYSDVGKGGYAKSTVYLKKDQLLCIAVGEKGRSFNASMSGGTYGGGGSAGSEDGYTGAGGTFIIKVNHIGEGYSWDQLILYFRDTSGHNYDDPNELLVVGGGAGTLANGGGNEAESAHAYYYDDKNSTYVDKGVALSGGSQWSGGQFIGYDNSKVNSYLKKGKNVVAGDFLKAGDPTSNLEGHNRLKSASGGGGGYYAGAGVIYSMNNNWSISSTGGSSYGDYTKAGVRTGNGYAKITFVPPTYSVTLNTNGGKINSGNITSYQETVGAKLPTNVTKAGYTFAGWYENASFNGNPITEIPKGSTGNKTYYAKWTPKIYTISYDLQGGTLSTSNPTTFTVNTQSFTLNNPTKVVDTITSQFTGWYDTVNKTNLGTSVTLPNGVYANRSLRATWKEIIVADINGGTKYSFMQDAINAAQPGDTINLLSDITESVSISGTNKNNININLNGHIWNSDASSVITVASNVSNLTLLDNSDVKYVTVQEEELPELSINSKIYSTGNKNVINNSGSIIIKGIIIGAEGSGKAIENNGTISIESNTVRETTTENDIKIGSDISSNSGIAINNNGTLTISGIKYEDEDNYSFSTLITSNSSTAIENRGNLLIKDNAYVDSNSGIALNNLGKHVTITDSNVSSEENIAIKNIGDTSDITSYLKINGDSMIISNSQKAIENSNKLQICDDTIVSICNGPATYNEDTNTFTVNINNEVTILNNENGEIVFNGGYVTSSIDKDNDSAEDYEIIVQDGTPKTILNKGKLTIEEDEENTTSINSSYGIAIYNENSGTLALNSGEINGKDIGIENYSNNANISNTNIPSAKGISIHNNENAKIIVSDSNLTGTYNTTFKNEGTAEINNCEVYSDEGIAVENTANKTLKIVNSKISSTYGTAINNKGNLNINGSANTDNSVIANYGTALYNEGKTNLNGNIQVISYVETAINNVQDGEPLYSDSNCNVQINNAQINGKVLGIYVQIAFETNGGTINQNPVKVLYNSKAEDLPQVTREGYVFKGWYEDQELKDKFVYSYNLLKKNSTYYADWLKGSGDYVIVLHSRGGEIDVEDYDDGFITYYPTYTHKFEDEVERTFDDVYVIKYKYSWYESEGDLPFDLPTPVKDENEFDYWVDNQGNAKQLYIEAPNYGDMELWASYKGDPYIPGQGEGDGNTYTITLHTEGGIINSENITCNGSVYTMQYTSGNQVTIPTPTRGTDTFIGWYNDKGYKVSSTIDSSTTGDKEFWAHWKIDKTNPDIGKIRNITLHTNGGTISNDEIDSGRVEEIVKNYTYIMSYREGYGLNQLPTPTKGNENFVGWYDFKTGDKVESISENAIGDKDLNAVWGNNIYKIRIWKQNRNANYEFYYDTIPYMVIVCGGTAGEQVTLDNIKNIYSSEQHTLNTQKSTISGTITAENNLVLDLYFDLNEAKYTVNHYIVSKSGVVELCKSVRKSDLLGKEIIPTDVQIPIGGYTLDVARSTGGNITLGEELIANLYYTENNDVNYNVKYFVEKEQSGLDLNNPNSYEESTEFVGKDYNTRTAKIGTVINLSQIVVPEKDGYEVNTNLSNIGGILNQDGTITKNGETLPELRVYLQRKEFSLTLYGNGGKIQGQNVYVTTYKYGSEKQILPLPDERTDGINFAGWTLTRDNSGTTYTYLPAKTTGPKAYFAKWTDKNVVTYKVQYYLQNENLSTNIEDYVPYKHLNDLKQIIGIENQIIDDVQTIHEGFNLNTTLSQLGGKLLANGKVQLGTQELDYINIYLDRITYDVILNTNGGNINSGNITSYAYGVTTKLPTDITKQGYTFAGWYENEVFSGVAQTEILSGSTGTKEYWAKWIKSDEATYKIEVFLQNTDLNSYSYLKSIDNVATKKSTITAEEAAEFIYSMGIVNNEAFKLNNNNSFGGYINSEGKLVTKEDSVVKLYFDRRDFSVTFETNNGVINSGNIVKYTYGIITKLPTDVTKEGEYFVGWYENPDLLGIKITEIPEGSIGAKTYYAKWSNTPIAQTANIKVQFYKQDAKNLDSYVEVEPIREYAREINSEINPTNIEIPFKGYHINLDLSDITGTVLEDGTVRLQSGATVPVLRVFLDRDSYTVTLNTNGGVITDSRVTNNSGTYTMRYVYTEPTEDPTYLPIPTKDSDKFTGWFKQPDFSGMRVRAIAAGERGDKTYYASWNRFTYKVLYYMQSATNLSEYVLDSSKTKVIVGNLGETITIDLNDEADFEKYVDFVDFHENDTHYNRKTTGIITEDCDLTLRLYFDRNEYNVTLYPNGGTINGITPQIYETTYIYGIEKELPKPSKTNYTFIGWYDKDNINTGNSIAAGEIGNKVYYANWKEGQEPEYNGQYSVEYWIQTTDLGNNYELYGSKTYYNANINQTITIDGTTNPIPHIGFVENKTHSGRVASGIVAEDGSLVLRLYFNRAVYNINYNTDGGTINGSKPETYIYGIGPIGLPTDVTKTKNRFKGWYDIEDTNYLKQIKRILIGEYGDKSYKAKWLEEGKGEYAIITYYQDSKDSSRYPLSYTWDNLKVDVGTNITVSESDFARCCVYQGYKINVGKSKTNITVKEDTKEVIELYYDYMPDQGEERQEYKVTLLTNGGNIINCSDIKVVEQNQKYETTHIYGIPKELPNREEVIKQGSTFEGWYYTNDKNEEIGPVYVIKDLDEGDKTFYAKWSNGSITNPGKYKIETYYKVGNTYPIRYDYTDIGEIGSIVNIENPQSYCALTGYLFNESNSKVKGTIKADGSLVLKLYFDYVGGRPEYKVTLVTRGGTVNSGYITSYIYGIPKVLPTDVTKANDIFKGWHKDENVTQGPILVIAAGERGDKTYYAKWQSDINDDLYLRTRAYVIGNTINPEGYRFGDITEYKNGDKYISRVAPYMKDLTQGTTANTFKNNIEVTAGANVEILGLDGNAISDNDLVGTGMTLKVTKGNKQIQVKIVVIGDVDGDGVLTANDLDRELDILVDKKINSEKILSEEIMKMSVDTDFDGKGATANDTDIMLDAIVNKLELKNH